MGQDHIEANQLINPASISTIRALFEIVQAYFFKHDEFTLSKELPSSDMSATGNGPECLRAAYKYTSIMLMDSQSHKTNIHQAKKES